MQNCTLIRNSYCHGGNRVQSCMLVSKCAHVQMCWMGWFFKFFKVGKNLRDILRLTSVLYNKCVVYITLNKCVAAAKSLQSCPTLCHPIDGSPPGSPVPGILQARTLEWGAISFSNAWKWKVKAKSLRFFASLVRLFATPWSAAYQAPPSMGFSRREYWSGVPLPSPNKCVILQ